MKWNYWILQDGVPRRSELFFQLLQEQATSSLYNILPNFAIVLLEVLYNYRLAQRIVLDSS